jgi:hypothetical protein
LLFLIVAVLSAAASAPAAIIGECDSPVEDATWGKIKAMYR